jgi:hypothetical protein
LLVNANFFRANHLHVAPTWLHGWLQALAHMQPAARNWRDQSRVTRIQELDYHAHDRRWYGDLVSFRLDVTKDVSNLAGHSDPIPLQPTEGIGERTAFSYDPDMQVLALQSNRAGATSSRLAAYLTELSQTPNAIEFLPMLTATAVQRFVRMERFSKFSVRIAGDIDGALWGNMGHSGAALRQLNEFFGAPSISLDVSVGREWRNRSLIPQAIRDAVAAMLGFAEDDELDRVQSVIVKGAAGDEDFDEVNLIRERIEYGEDLEPDGRELTFEIRRNWLRRAFAERRAELQAVLPPQ